MHNPTDTDDDGSAHNPSHGRLRGQHKRVVIVVGILALALSAGLALAAVDLGNDWTQTRAINTTAEFGVSQFNSLDINHEGILAGSSGDTLVVHDTETNTTLLNVNATAEYGGSGTPELVADDVVHLNSKLVDINTGSVLGTTIPGNAEANGDLIAVHDPSTGDVSVYHKRNYTAISTFSTGIPTDAPISIAPAYSSAHEDTIVLQEGSTAYRYYNVDGTLRGSYSQAEGFEQHKPSWTANYSVLAFGWRDGTEDRRDAVFVNDSYQAEMTHTQMRDERSALAIVGYEPSDEYAWLYRSYDGVDNRMRYDIHTLSSGGTETDIQYDGESGVAAAFSNDKRYMAHSTASEDETIYVIETDWENAYEEYEPPNRISGQVEDGNNYSAIDNATITVRQNGSVITTAETDYDGAYTVDVEDGTYNISASADGYMTRYMEATAPETSTADFRLYTPLNEIELDTVSYLAHDSRADYTVTHRERVPNGTLTTADVSTDATLSVSETGVLTIDTTELDIVSTSDTSVNAEVVLNASYDPGDGLLYDDQNVTVANSTLPNTDILPPSWRFNAFMTDDGIFLLLISIMMAVAGTRFSSAFGGLSVGTVVVIIGWVGGYVSTGTVMIAVATAAFIGLNLAANIDYSVRR